MEGLILLVGAVSASLVSVIYACFGSIRKSRCSSINCGCVHCQREVMSEKEMKIDYKHDEKMMMMNRRSEEVVVDSPNNTNRPSESNNNFNNRFQKVNNAL